MSRSYRRIGADLKPNCHGCMALVNNGERYCTTCDRTRRAGITRERIAQADSYLNDVSLPSYLEVARALHQLTQDPRLEGYETDAYSEAERVLEQLGGLL